MPINPILRGGPLLPAETFAELVDGLTLAADALEGRRLHRREIEEARGHLRFAKRCAMEFLDSMGGDHAAR
jgi:hypothetical protein